jgi:hypothetical protein
MDSRVRENDGVAYGGSETRKGLTVANGEKQVPVTLDALDVALVEL